MEEFDKTQFSPSLGKPHNSTCNTKCQTNNTTHNTNARDNNNRIPPQPSSLPPSLPSVVTWQDTEELGSKTIERKELKAKRGVPALFSEPVLLARLTKGVGSSFDSQAAP